MTKLIIFDLDGVLVEAKEIHFHALNSALKNEAINQKIQELEDAGAIKIIKSEVKKRKDSIVSYEEGGRQDLADAEKAEIVILETYLPIIEMAFVSYDSTRCKETIKEDKIIIPTVNSASVRTSCFIRSSPCSKS